MNTSNNNIQDFIKEKLELLKNWLFQYSKIIMPVVLVICVVITVAIAVNANRKKTAEEEVVQPEQTEPTEIVNSLIAVPEVPLEKEAVPEISELCRTYYQAMVDGDTDTMNRICAMDELETLRAQVVSKYMESCPVLEIYTKVGPQENTYIAYIYQEVKFYDYEEPLPGLNTYYVYADENGDYHLQSEGDVEESILNYIREVNLQDDFVDLHNKVTVAYNDMVDGDEELRQFLVDLNEEIDKDVGKALADRYGSEESGEGTETAQGQDDAAEGGDEQPDEPETVVTKVKATDVVNIRSSDSETADKLGKAAIGDEFTLLEERGNGWSKVSYEGGEAFIKSEYLEPSEVVRADETGTGAGQETGDDNTAAQTHDDESAETTGTVTVKENVRIRAGASEDSEKIATAYVGEKLEVIMKQADGWTKIKYNGKTAYVKSDYVE